MNKIKNGNDGVKNQDDNNRTRIKPSNKKPNIAERTRIAAANIAVTDDSVCDDKTRVKNQIVKEFYRQAGSAQYPSKIYETAASLDKTRFIVRNPSNNQSFQEPDVASHLHRISIHGKVQKSDKNSEQEIHGILKNRFILEDILGAGGMGIVYKAKDMRKVEAQDNEPYIAIKVLSEEFKEHPDAFIALQRESRKAQKIAHPNIVTVYDFDRDGDIIFMTMEYLEGRPLDKLINRYHATGLPRGSVWKILQGLCAALAHAHSQNIIHADFKPGNIFVSPKGIAKVFDFGVSRVVAQEGYRGVGVGDRTVFDPGGLGALTPVYASLEMLEGAEPDVRDDIYALGCIAYELLTGAHPYDRMHADEARDKKLKPKRIKGLTRRQWAAIKNSLSLERNKRTKAVDEFMNGIKNRNVSMATTLLVLFFFLIVFTGSYYKFSQNRHYEHSINTAKEDIENRNRFIGELATQDTFFY